MTDSEKIDCILELLEVMEARMTRIENTVSAIQTTLGLVAEID